MEDEITWEAFHVLEIPYRSLITGSSSVGNGQRGSQLEKLAEEQTGSRKGHSDRKGGRISYLYNKNKKL